MKDNELTSPRIMGAESYDFFSNSFLEIDSKISHQSNDSGSRECDVKNPEENKEKLDPHGSPISLKD